MGILNRTKDSFYEPAATFDLDALFERADKLVIEGADLLDIGGVKAAPVTKLTKPKSSNESYRWSPNSCGDSTCP